MTFKSLPPPTEPSQSYWEVSILDIGHLTLPPEKFIDPVPAPTATHLHPNPQPLVPSLSFFLQRPTASESTQSLSRTPILFDLSFTSSAMSPTESTLSPSAIDWIATWAPLHVRCTVPEALEEGGMKADDIEYVILSHVHWDHVGDPRWFDRARFVVGAGARTVLEDGYPTNPLSNFMQDLLPPDRTIFLPETHSQMEAESTWEPIGPFPHAYDVFSDRSLYIIDSPGHLPGHINLLVRVSSQQDWVYLAGDSAHHPGLLRGDGEIAVMRHPGTGERIWCAHLDKETAEEHLERIKELIRLGGGGDDDGTGEKANVKVFLAHDVEWYEENKGGPMFWPGKV